MSPTSMTMRPLTVFGPGNARQRPPGQCATAPGVVPKPGVPTTDYVYAWDYAPVAASHFFTALSALLVWLLGRKLFDLRVGVLSASAFLVSDLVWRQSLLGSSGSAATFFALGSVYAALWAAELPAGFGPDQEQGPMWRWLIPLVLSSLLTAAAFLTRYAAGDIALLLVFAFLGASRRRRFAATSASPTPRRRFATPPLVGHVGVSDTETALPATAASASP